MEAHLPSPRKALAMHEGLFALGDDACSTISPKNCIGSRNFDRLSIDLSIWLAMIVSTCFGKNTVWVHHNASDSDFINVVLIRTLPGALADSFC